MMRCSIKKLLWIFVPFLAACGGSNDDLQAYIADVNGRKTQDIEPIPEVKVYERFEYDGAGLRDPFDKIIFGRVEKEVVEGNDDLCPDPNRPREALEEFPLDGLRMVGTLRQDGATWALVKSPEGTVYRVQSSNHIGLNYGVINSITDTKIEITEIITNPQGGCEERDVALALSDS